MRDLTKYLIIILIAFLWQGYCIAQETEQQEKQNYEAKKQEYLKNQRIKQQEKYRQDRRERYLLQRQIITPNNNQKTKDVPDSIDTKNLTVFPDEYTELDDYNNINTKDNEVVLQTLEHARQKYLQALIFVDKGDTTNAAHFFEKAIEILNRVASYPGIEHNENFSDLAQLILDDYEGFVKTIESLDDNSPFFVVRDKLFRAIDSIQPIRLPEVTNIPLPHDTIPSLIGVAPLVPEPKQVTINLDDNEEVQKNIAFITSEGKKGGKRFFQKWLERSGKWFPMMRRLAAEEEMPEELIYLSMIESGLKPGAVSKSKAVGLWQFLRTTGEDYELNVTPSVWIDERRDPEKSTRAAMRFLRDLYNRFGDWHLALAAYNCGGGRVSRTLKEFGNDSSTYWDIRDKLPKETQHYVPIYIAATKIALNPQAYGFNLDSIDFDKEYKYETYELSEPVSLSVIAKCVDTTREAIQDLNPELIRAITPPDVDKYIVKIPVSKTQLFVANYSTLTPEDKEPWIEHKILRGESISKLARQYGVSRKEIASANGLPSYKSRLAQGTVIKIPVDKDYIAEKKRLEEDRAMGIVDAEIRQQTADDSQQSADGSQQKADNSQKSSDIKPQEIAEAVKAPIDPNKHTHTVLAGETLYSIANRYGINQTELRNLNNIPFDDDNLRTGRELIISPANSTNSINIAKEETIGTSKIIRHKVKAGETLHSLAENYNVSVEGMINLNNIIGDKIIPGQMLAIEITSGASNNLTTGTATVKTIIHKVKKGETLGLIASTYGVTEEDLLLWNKKTIKNNKLRSGTNIKIEEPNLAKGSADAQPKQVNKAPKYYTVRRGDTLSAISRKFGVSIKDLTARNKGLSADNVLIGQKIRIQ